MLTAIQDFVRDSFSGGEGDLEEIAHGDLRILLESGQYAYIAVVVDGVEPVGFSNQISDVVHTINLQFEKELKRFDGDMGSLPDLKPILGHLRSVKSEAQSNSDSSKPLPLAQKRIICIGVVSLILLLVVLIFACIYYCQTLASGLPECAACHFAFVIPLSAPFKNELSYDEINLCLPIIFSSQMAWKKTDRPSCIPRPRWMIAPALSPEELLQIIQGLRCPDRAQPDQGYTREVFDGRQATQGRWAGRCRRG